MGELSSIGNTKCHREAFVYDRQDQIGDEVGGYKDYYEEIDNGHGPRYVITVE